MKTVEFLTPVFEVTGKSQSMSDIAAVYESGE